jgi:GMP synthase PP-ATPase subunit
MDPETRRKTILEEFEEIVDDCAAALENDDW